MIDNRYNRYRDVDWDKFISSDAHIYYIEQQNCDTYQWENLKVEGFAEMKYYPRSWGWHGENDDPVSATESLAECVKIATKEYENGGNPTRIVWRMFTNMKVIWRDREFTDLKFANQFIDEITGVSSFSVG